MLSLLVLAVMLPGLAFARAEYLCRTDKVIRSACCCPSDTAASKERNASTSIKASCCCDVSTIASTSQISSERNDTSPLPTPAIRVSTVASSETSVAVAIRELPQVLAPPKLQDSLLARRCMFLL